MQKIIGFVGYVDKSELLINIAKLLTIMKKRVLVLDSTSEKRLKYAIPTFDVLQQQMLITFDNIDFAVGFKSVEEIKEYVCTKTSNSDDYDYILVDIDCPSGYDLYKTQEFEKKYFFMEYTTMSLRRNEELIAHMLECNTSDERMQFTKVLFKYYVSRASRRYFEDRLYAFNVDFKDEEYEYVYNDEDRLANTETELSGYIDISRHSRQYVMIVTDMVADIIGDVNAGDIRKAMKDYTRGKL